MSNDRGLACKHTKPERDGHKIFSETTEKFRGDFRKLLAAGFADIHKEVAVPECLLCGIVYAAWKAHRDRHTYARPHFEEESYCDDGSENDSTDTMVYFQRRDSDWTKVPWIDLAAQGEPERPVDCFKIVLSTREYGEAYQTLICCLLAKQAGMTIGFEVQDVQGHKDLKDLDDLRHTSREESNGRKVNDILKSNERPGQVAAISKWYNEQVQSGRAPASGDVYAQCTKRMRQIHERKQELQDLFQWYDIKPDNDVPGEAKRRARDVIAGEFRSTNRNDSHDDASADLFASIRNELATQWVPKQHGELKQSKSREVVAFGQRYLTTTWAAEYWLNLYLSVTEQPQLPKASEVSRLAVVYIRRHPKSSDGRVMDDDTLKYVARSIAAVNSIARQAEEARFSHVVLYGDFWYSEIQVLRDVFTKQYNWTRKEKAFSDVFLNDLPTVAEVQLLFI